MRRGLAVAVLSAAVAGLLPTGAFRSVARAADAPAAADKAEQAKVPVKQVVLFSSGVGYFEHYGTVQGDGSTELSFKTQQINDVLKSLVLQDLDKGRVTAVTYPSQDPIAKTLRSFQVDITSNPALHDLLEQLRGADVSLQVGAEAVTGTILGVEKRQKPGEKDRPAVETWHLNLLSGASIRQVDLDQVRAVELKDEKLRDELHKALAALSQARDQDKKPVTIRFAGKGERRVRLGYVVEAPVWKTSYRLILSGPGDLQGEKGQKDNGDKKGKAGPATKPGEGGAKPSTEANLQGWAIIENQTDNDWNDVQLSLVSGRPISFIQDLYRPLYIPRPTVQPELYASLTPQTYEGGMDSNKRPLANFSGGTAAAPAMTPPPAPSARPGVAMDQLARRAGRAEDGKQALAEESENLASLGAIDASASVSSAASAAKLGELFQYTVGSVSLPRQKSAMIPIVTDAVEAERLSIYNLSVLAKHPLNGARLKNTTGKHLLAGPVTVLEAGSYAGDASIDNLPPGQERLISYGIDLRVLVDATKNRQEDAVLSGKVVKGVLTVSRRHVFTQEYLAENKGDKDKTLVVEHPRRGGGWKLDEAKGPTARPRRSRTRRPTPSTGSGGRLRRGRRRSWWWPSRWWTSRRSPCCRPTWGSWTSTSAPAPSPSR